jgi:hypothetical protein
MKKKLALFLFGTIIVSLAAGLIPGSPVRELWDPTDKTGEIIRKAEAALNGKADIYTIAYIETTDSLPIEDNSVIVIIEFLSTDITIEEFQVHWEIIQPHMAKLNVGDSPYFYLFSAQNGYIILGQRCKADGLNSADLMNTECETATFYFLVPEEYMTYKN